MTPFERYCEMIQAGEIGNIPWSLREINGENNRTLAHWAAERKLLPDDFSEWLIEDAHGLTVVEVALASDGLPDDFSEWDMMLWHHGCMVAHKAAETGKLPASFDRWDFSTESGTTVAHILADLGQLPVSLLKNPVMGVCDQDGISPFHILARNGALPEGFDKWDHAGSSGWTVAHEAVSGQVLDNDFSWWHLRDEDGTSVARAALIHDSLPEDFSHWEIEDADGRTVAHEFVRLRRDSFPAGFDQWALEDREGNTVAHTAVLFDRFPADFEAWDLKNRSGETVEAYLKRLVAERDKPPLKSFAHYEAWRMNQAIQSVPSASSRIRKHAC